MLARCEEDSFAYWDVMKNFKNDIYYKGNTVNDRQADAKHPYLPLLKNGYSKTNSFDSAYTHCPMVYNFIDGK
ncbi:hypothetical protein [Chitinophaga skermanii]|nr:hypothetical protein [Chitinophaga skermanii]